MDECGIMRLTAFAADPTVYYFAELREEDSFDRFLQSDVTDRWGATFEGQIAFTDDGQVDLRFMDEIFHLDTEPV